MKKPLLVDDWMQAPSPASCTILSLLQVPAIERETSFRFLPPLRSLNFTVEPSVLEDGSWFYSKIQ